MKSNKLKRFFIGVLGSAILLVGIGLTTAQAQGRVIIRPRPFIVRPYWGPRWGWGPYWGPTYTVVNPIAAQREQGYSDGHKQGKDDAKHERANAPEDQKKYLKSDSMTYRQAFLKGYADGFDEQLNKRG